MKTYRDLQKQLAFLHKHELDMPLAIVDESTGTPIAREIEGFYTFQRVVWTNDPKAPAHGPYLLIV